MEKKTYYVAVGSGEVLENKGDVANYEFEIQATDEELDKLQELFERTDNAAQGTLVRGATPYKEYSFDKENDQYDDDLQDIYRMLHDLGNEATRKHIESMNILH
jgi:hypothetical protein